MRELNSADDGLRPANCVHPISMVQGGFDNRLAENRQAMPTSPPDWFSYRLSLTKHAREGLTKTMAFEVATQGIRVLFIALTFVEMPTYRKMAAARPEFAQWVRGRIPAGRLGQPEEVAAAVVFVASPAASLMAGTSHRPRWRVERAVTQCVADACPRSRAESTRLERGTKFA